MSEERKRVPPLALVRFDLEKAGWKSKASRWKHSTRPKGLDRTRKIMLVIYYCGRAKGTIWFDRIRVQ